VVTGGSVFLPAKWAESLSQTSETCVQSGREEAQGKFGGERRGGKQLVHIIQTRK
jgi:hypothetical protein